MKIPTTVLLSAVLVVTSLTTMAMPTFNANITNFPLDEEGNLKVTQMDGEQNLIIKEHATKLITLAVNENVGSGSHWTSGYLSIDGYSKMTILSYINTHHNSLQLWAVCNEDIYPVESAVNFPAYWIRTYDVMSPQMWLGIDNDDSMTNYVTVYIYLVA